MLGYFASGRKMGSRNQKQAHSWEFDSLILRPTTQGRNHPTHWAPPKPYDTAKSQRGSSRELPVRRRKGPTRSNSRSEVRRQDCHGEQPPQRREGAQTNRGRGRDNIVTARRNGTVAATNGAMTAATRTKWWSNDGAQMTKEERREWGSVTAGSRN